LDAARVEGIVGSCNFIHKETQMNFVKAATAVALSLAGALVVLAVQAEDQPSVAVVNGVPISQARMDYVVKAQTQQGQQKDSPEFRAQVKDVLITREVLAQEAIKKGLDKNPEVQTQLEIAKQEFLIRAYFDDFIKNNAPSEEATKAEYEKIKASQAGTANKMEYKGRHILVKTEKEAKAIVASLDKAKGKNFAQLAKTKSLDNGSKNDGGALDWSDGSNYVPEFTAALTKLEKGTYTKTPVKTKFGYHIIMLDDTRPVEFPPYEQVKDRVQQEMLKQARDKKIEELRAAAKVE
jgi:peptidyl-prolyl cis-trans isomerase C